MIYLDHAATTPLRPEARAVLAEFAAADGPFANPASLHAAGRAMARRIEEARERLAALLGAEPADILWTSGATEANNLAILGRARFAASLGRGLVVPRTEHKAVIDPVRHLAGQGRQVQWLDPAHGAYGICTADDFAARLTGETILACAMAVNNETGQCQDVAAIAGVCAEHGVPLHVDAAQALGKVPLTVDPGVGSMSLSAHKLGGPTGIGALYLRSRPRVGVEPLQFGGGQERGLRSGTLASMNILAFVAAAEAACAEREAAMARLASLREATWQRLTGGIAGLIRNGTATHSSPHILNISVPGVHGDALRALLGEVCLSSGSACSSAQAESSYVLRALGHSDDLANASLRLSFGHSTDDAEVTRAVDIIIEAVRVLRERAVP